MSSRKPFLRLLFNALSWITSLSLLVISGVFLFGSDYDWPAMLATSVPPVIFALAPLALLIVSVVMRRRRMLWVNGAALLLAAGPIMGFHWRFDAPPVQGRVVRVMTWNVEKWSHGPDAVARGVRAEHPDVVCFQEAGDYFYVQGSQGKELIAALPEYHFVRAGEIIIASRWPVTKLAETPLPPGPASRSALSVAVTIDRRQFVVTSAHLIPSEYDRHILDSREPLGVYARRLAAARSAQGAALARAMAALRGPEILCGDFNAQPRANICRQLTRTYPDAFDAGGRGYGYTLTAAAPVMCIDHILTSPGLAVRNCWVPNIVASDHRPVVADITLPTPQSP